MAQLIGEELQIVGTKVAVVPDDVVVGGTTGALDGGMGAQVEVVLSRMCDDSVDCGPRWDVPALSNGIALVLREEPRVVAFLHHNERDPWPVVLLQFQTGTLQG